MEKKNINEVIAELSVEQLAGMIDHTFLKPFGDASPIEKLCAEARQYQFAMVAINPAEVEICVKLLEGSGVRVGAAIGFPLGQNTVECKAFETRDAIAKGATEIDTVINVRALQKGQTEIVKKEIEDMVSICKPAGVICKVILETCYLTDEEKETVCRIAKEAGVDFVMLRVGARGYGSGQIVLDDYFVDNIKRATDAGLQIGVYFTSQAITEEEAVEESNIVLENIKDYKITYPVAFDMSFVDNDTTRIETVSRADKTKITKAFLDTIEAAGYKPLLYGDKEWLIKEIDLSKLSAYDVWLSQMEDVPDYPYRFTMWQYANDVTIDGIAGYANMNISFIDYSEK